MALPPGLATLFRRKKSWDALLARYPADWGRALDHIMANTGGTTGTVTTADIEAREKLTLAAIEEVAGADAAAFVEFFHNRQVIAFDCYRDPRPPVLKRIEGFSAEERTHCFVNVLRAIKMLDATSATPKNGQQAGWSRDQLARLQALPDLAYMHVDLEHYPPYLDAGYHGNFGRTNVAYAAAELAKGPMSVPEPLAIEMLRLLPTPYGKRLLFAKGLAKHLVKPYRAAPSDAYVDAFEETRRFLNDGYRSFGRGNAWSDFRHYLRAMMNKAAEK